MEDLSAAEFDAVRRQIEKRRAQCLVHRYLYYYKNESLVTDAFYDNLERELRALVSQYPRVAATAKYDEDCPTRAVGSSILDTYPKAIQMLGDSLAIYNPENLDWLARLQEAQENKEILDEPIAENSKHQPSLFG